MHARLAVVALTVVATATAAAPPAGRLDPRFGGDGLVVARLTDGHDVGRGLVTLPNGSVVVAAESGGHVEPFLGPDAVLLRLRASGTVDRTFGSGGVTRVSIGRGDDQVSGAARTPDGRIVVGGVAENLNGDAYGDDAAFYAFRVRASGRLDPTFGRQGIASIRFPVWVGSGALAGIAPMPEGGVVVGANRTTESERNRLGLVRFDRRGRVDRGFGTNGIAAHDVQFPFALTSHGGRLLVVGMTDSNRDWFVLRLRPDGSRDRTFGGGDGLAVTSFGSTPDSATAVAVDARGRIVVAGYTNIADADCTTLCSQLRLVRYQPDGRVDGSFGRLGRVTPATGLGHDELGLALQADGGIVVAGAGHAPGTQDPQLALWRFDDRGRLDRTFGTDGTLAVNPTDKGINVDFLTSVELGAGGRIVAAGAAAKPKTGFDSRILYDVAVLGAR